MSEWLKGAADAMELGGGEGDPAPSRVVIPEGTQPNGLPQLARRNNNPGNLGWAGQKGASEGDKGFARFATAEDGYRALHRQVVLDQGRNLSLRDFLSKYAPSFENNTERYISRAKKALGIGEKDPIAGSDPHTLARFIAGQESGTRVDPSFLREISPPSAAPARASADASAQVPEMLRARRDFVPDRVMERGADSPTSNLSREVTRRQIEREQEPVRKFLRADTPAGKIAGLVPGLGDAMGAAGGLIDMIDAKREGGSAVPGAVQLAMASLLGPVIGREGRAAKQSLERGNPELRDIAASFLREHAPAGSAMSRIDEWSRPHAEQMAQAFAALKSDPSHPEVRSAYAQFGREVEQQAGALRKAGYSPSYMADDPYDNSAAMLDDLRANKNSRVFKTTPDQQHPLLTNEQNDQFRWVHDVFGHGQHGNQFGPWGEELAYRDHAAMFSPEARRAMATETRGQNSWVNAGPGAHLPVGERPFAEQKAALWPEHLMGEYEQFPPSGPPAPPGSAPAPDIAPSASAPAGGTAPAPGGALSPALARRAQSALPDRARTSFPGIYNNPREIAQGAEGRVAPESSWLSDLFGVTRADLAKTAERGGTLTPEQVLPEVGEGARGSASAERVMTPGNTARLRRVLEAGREHAPELTKGMSGWYVMDPAYQRLLHLSGDADEAKKLYDRFNTSTTAMSPSSGVIPELLRGSALNRARALGDPDAFFKFGGKRDAPGTPDWLAGVPGHAYHSTAHTPGMRAYLESGEFLPGSPKVRPYMFASGVPETGLQTDVPVGDAHWSRGVGLPDVRGGSAEAQNKSVSAAEARTLAPWFRERVAKNEGFRAVPGQATLWGLLSGQTGVTTPVGAPKLELLSDLIAQHAQRLRMNPRDLRDAVLMGAAHLSQRERPQSLFFR